MQRTCTCELVYDNSALLTIFDDSLKDGAEHILHCQIKTLHEHPNIVFKDLLRKKLDT